MAEEINVDILPDGTVNIDMVGYKGSACSLDLKKIAKAIGSVVTSRKKADYYEDSDVKIKQTE